MSTTNSSGQNSGTAIWVAIIGVIGVIIAALIAALIGKDSEKKEPIQPTQIIVPSPPPVPNQSIHITVDSSVFNGNFGDGNQTNYNNDK